MEEKFSRTRFFAQLMRDNWFAIFAAILVAIFVIDLPGNADVRTEQAVLTEKTFTPSHATKSVFRNGYTTSAKKSTVADKWTLNLSLEGWGCQLQVSQDTYNQLNPGQTIAVTYSTSRIFKTHRCTSLTV